MKKLDDKECTFKPNLSKKGIVTPNNTHTRNLEEFLNFQKGFADRKEHKLEQMKQQLTERESAQFTGRPMIDNKSKRIVSRNMECDEPVFSRLSREK